MNLLPPQHPPASAAFSWITAAQPGLQRYSRGTSVSSELLRLLGHPAGLRNPHIPALKAAGAATEAGASGKQGTQRGHCRDHSGTREGWAGFRLEPGGIPVGQIQPGLTVVGPWQDPGRTQVNPGCGLVRPSPAVSLSHSLPGAPRSC